MKYLITIIVYFLFIHINYSQTACKETLITIGNIKFVGMDEELIKKGLAGDYMGMRQNQAQFRSLKSFKVCSSILNGDDLLYINLGRGYDSYPSPITYWVKQYNNILGKEKILLLESTLNEGVFYKLKYDLEDRVLGIQYVSPNVRGYNNYSYTEVFYWPSRAEIAKRNAERNAAINRIKTQEQLKIKDYNQSSLNLSSKEKLEELEKLISSLNYKYPELEKELIHINKTIDKEKIDDYHQSSLNLSSKEKLEEFEKLISSLNYKYPELEKELIHINKAIDKEKIDNYNQSSLNLSSKEKLDKLDKLIPSLNYEDPELEKERKEVFEGYVNEGIEKSLKNNDYKTARKFFSATLDTYPKSLDADKLEKFIRKVFPHIDIINRVYADMWGYNEYKAKPVYKFSDILKIPNRTSLMNLTQAVNVRSLLWILTYSTIEFVDFKWYKDGKLILIGSDGKLYGGKKNWYKNGLFINLKNIYGVRRMKDDPLFENLPKIKNSEINEVPTIPNQGPFYDPTKITPEYKEFQEMIDKQQKTNEGWPKYYFEIRHNTNVLKKNFLI